MQAFCELNKTAAINILCVFAKFVSFGERLRSLNQAIEFVSFVQFVVKTNQMIVLPTSNLFTCKRRRLQRWLFVVSVLFLNFVACS